MCVTHPNSMAIFLWRPGNRAGSAGQRLHPRRRRPACGTWRWLNDHGKTMGNPWENHRKPIGKWWFHGIQWDFIGFYGVLWDSPSGKRLHNHGKSPFLQGKLTRKVKEYFKWFDDTLWLCQNSHWRCPRREIEKLWVFPAVKWWIFP